LCQENTEEQKESARKALEGWKSKASKPLEGELEKTDEQIEIIKAANSLIGSELERIGIENFEPISPDQIHFLSEEVFDKKFPSQQGKSFYRSTDDNIYINLGKADSKARLLADILHESIHRASTKKFHLDPATKNITDARVGYRLHSPNKEDVFEREKLVGFNEIMNAYTQVKILYTHADKLKELGISEEDIKGPIYPYMNYEPIIKAIVNKISAQRNIPQADVFKDLERGQFESNIFNLKVIEKIFGKKSLKILSFLMLKGITSEHQEKLDKMIEGYFMTDDNSLREKIGAQIFEEIKRLKKAS
jgi:hypothetical protein